MIRSPEEQKLEAYRLLQFALENDALRPVIMGLIAQRDVALDKAEQAAEALERLSNIDVNREPAEALKLMILERDAERAQHQLCTGQLNALRSAAQSLMTELEERTYNEERGKSAAYITGRVCSVAAFEKLKELLKES